MLSVRLPLLSAVAILGMTFVANVLAGADVVVPGDAMRAASEPVRIDERVEYYRIEGRDLSALATQMKQHGPLHGSNGRRSAGVTHWEVAWSHRSQMQADGCRLVDLDVHVDIRVTLPRWEGDRGNSRSVREWRRFFASLELHEATHRQHGRDAAVAVRDALWTVPVHPTCAQLERALDRAARRQLRRYAALTRRYDMQTGFGASEGVRLQY